MDRQDLSITSFIILTEGYPNRILMNINHFSNSGNSHFFRYHQLMCPACLFIYKYHEVVVYYGFWVGLLGLLGWR